MPLSLSLRSERDCKKDGSASSSFPNGGQFFFSSARIFMEKSGFLSARSKLGRSSDNWIQRGKRNPSALRVVMCYSAAQKRESQSYLGDFDLRPSPSEQTSNELCLETTDAHGRREMVAAAPKTFDFFYRCEINKLIPCG